MTKHKNRSDGSGEIPYWRRAHHDWRFWIAMVFMTIAISVYVLTQDLSFVHGERVSPNSNQHRAEQDSH